MIRDIHERSRGTYGWPRVHAELTLGLGERVNHKRSLGSCAPLGCRACTGDGGAAARSVTRPTRWPWIWSTASSRSRPGSAVAY